MKHFQYSVMGHGILLRSLGWATKISGKISFPPPAHPSSYFMTGPLFYKRNTYWFSVFGYSDQNLGCCQVSQHLACLDQSIQLRISSVSHNFQQAFHVQHSHFLSCV